MFSRALDALRGSGRKTAGRATDDDDDDGVVVANNAVRINTRLLLQTVPPPIACAFVVGDEEVGEVSSVASMCVFV